MNKESPDKPVKVAHLISQLTGGRGHLLVTAIPYWVANGIQPVIITPGEVIPKLQAFLREAGAQLVQPATPADSPAERLAFFARHLEASAYDVVHIHDRRNLGIHARIVRRRHRGPIVATIHGCGKPPGLRERLASALTRQWSQKRLGVAFVAVSSDVQAMEKRNFGLRCLAIPNWTRPDLFTPPDPELRLARRREWNIPGDIPVLVTVANCAPVKRHALIIQALALLKKERPAFLLLHAGKERDESERVLAASLGVESQIRFLGRVDNVPGLLQASDLFVMASSREGLSLASIEALSAGLPAVLTRSPGLACLAHAFSGLTYADSTPESLAAAMKAALLVPAALRADEARTNYATVCARFSPRAGAASYAALYRNMLRGKRSLNTPASA